MIVALEFLIVGASASLAIRHHPRQAERLPYYSIADD
jgi:hypothetical protein